MAREASTLERIQEDSQTWREANFSPDTRDPHHQFMGMVEELGEIAHVMLKSEQMIREFDMVDNVANREAELRDGIGDLCIFMMGFCSNFGWSLQDIIEETWHKVSKRDWVKDPRAGGEGEEDRMMRSLAPHTDDLRGDADR